MGNTRTLARNRLISFKDLLFCSRSPLLEFGRLIRICWLLVGRAGLNFRGLAARIIWFGFETYLNPCKIQERVRSKYVIPRTNKKTTYNRFIVSIVRFFFFSRCLTRQLIANFERFYERSTNKQIKITKNS